MHFLENQSMDRLYGVLNHWVQTYGKPAGPRGLNCVECRPFVFTLWNPRDGLYAGSTRSLNYRFYAVETLQYLGGCGDHVIHADLLVRTNSNMEQFRNQDSGLFDGAYGPRLYNGLRDVYRILNRDPDSRQAAAMIWQPGLLGAFEGSRDVPCTLGLNFYRDVQSTLGMADPDTGKPKNRLSMTAMMRSNDMNWGVPYDVAAFCAIQCAMAGCLGWTTGEYTHLANSLHVYTDKMPKIPAYDNEAWIAGISVPDLAQRLGDKSRLDWDLFTYTCRLYLNELYVHVVTNNRSFVSFDPHYANILCNVHDPTQNIRLRNYFADWSNLIRFTHSLG